MATKRLSVLRSQISNAMGAELQKAVAERFPGLVIETSWNLLMMRRVTIPLSRRKFTVRQHLFIAAFDEGFEAALKRIL